jgi:hypothetical protein
MYTVNQKGWQIKQSWLKAGSHSSFWTIADETQSEFHLHFSPTPNRMVHFKMAANKLMRFVISVVTVLINKCKKIEKKISARKCPVCLHHLALITP